MQYSSVQNQSSNQCKTEKQTKTRNFGPIRRQHQNPSAHSNSTHTKQHKVGANNLIGESVRRNKNLETGGTWKRIGVKHLYQLHHINAKNY